VIAPRNEAVGALQEAPEVQPEAEADPEAEVVAPDASVEEPEEAAETFAKPFDALAEDGEPEPEPEAPDTSTSFTTQEREAIADQPTVFFEQQEPAELELGDLDLDLDEELEEVGDMINEPLTDEEPLVPEAATPAEPVGEVAPVEPLEETEPEFEPEPLTPTEPEAALEVEEVEAEALEAEPEDSALPAMDEGELTSEDDVLEETPEFLRENPDDDDLWFEQGAPKDFDF
jgi:hypothetical protein